MRCASEERLDYTLWWLKVTQEEIHDDPRSTLREHIHEQHAIGFFGWEFAIDELYRNPITLEERLLQYEVRAVLGIALSRALQLLHTDFASMRRLHNCGRDAYRALSLLALHDPLVTCHGKIALNALCTVRMQRSLIDTAALGFQLSGGEYQVVF